MGPEEPPREKASQSFAATRKDQRLLPELKPQVRNIGAVTRSPAGGSAALAGGHTEVRLLQARRPAPAGSTKGEAALEGPAGEGCAWEAALDNTEADREGREATRYPASGKELQERAGAVTLLK